MPIDPRQRLETLLAHIAPVQQRASAAVDRGAATARGSDNNESVTVSLNADGQVCAVQVRPGWRRQVPPQGLGAAVREAVQMAATQRLAMWGTAYANEPSADSAPAAASPDGNFAQRLQEAVSGSMSDEDVRTAVLELLAAAEDLERGLDDVTARLQQTVAAQYTGRSGAHQVTVTVAGNGAVVEVGYQPRWLRTAHEINISRQTMAAFTSAYALTAGSGIDRLIADSQLGALLRETQDPLGFARRLRLRD